jgi:hypothetical protein
MKLHGESVHLHTSGPVETILVTGKL